MSVQDILNYETNKTGLKCMRSRTDCAFEQSQICYPATHDFHWHTADSKVSGINALETSAPSFIAYPLKLWK